MERKRLFKITKTGVTVYMNLVAGPVIAGIAELWWIIVIVVGIFLLFLLLLICCICCYRNRGDVYPGNDPLF